jgi:hypothetical protein
MRERDWTNFDLGDVTRACRRSGAYSTDEPDDIRALRAACGSSWQEWHETSLPQQANGSGMDTPQIRTHWFDQTMSEVRRVSR